MNLIKKCEVRFTVQDINRSWTDCYPLGTIHMKPPLTVSSVPWTLKESCASPEPARLWFQKKKKRGRKFSFQGQQVVSNMQWARPPWSAWDQQSINLRCFCRKLRAGEPSARLVTVAEQRALPPVANEIWVTSIRIRAAPSSQSLTVSWSKSAETVCSNHTLVQVRKDKSIFINFSSDTHNTLR